MTGLYPTPTRLALLADVAAGRVFQDIVYDDYIAGGRKVNARIAELKQEGWVELDIPPLVGRELPLWLLTDAGRAVLAEADKSTSDSAA